MNAEHVLAGLLAPCTVCVDTGEGPAGTAFFVSPGYAITAAHVVSGQAGTRAVLLGQKATWRGQVRDTDPPGSAIPVDGFGLYPPPDLALIQVTDGPEHPCVLLGTAGAPPGSPVLVSGHTVTFGGEKVTAESEYFTVSGELETTDPDCVMIKLGHGHAVKGMSGAPVLSLRTGEVIGMLRTSRDLHSALGAWAVPASVIRASWPGEAGAAHDGYHRVSTRWAWVARRLAAPQTAPQSPEAGPGNSGPVTVITNSSFGDVNIGSAVTYNSPAPPPARREPADGR